MSLNLRRILLGLLALTACLAAAPAWAACTVGAQTINLGSAGSYTVANQQINGSGASGLACTGLVQVLGPSYIKVKLEASTLLLTGPGGKTIPFAIYPTSSATSPMAVGAEADMSSVTLLSLFSGPNGSIPMYVRTANTAGLTAGVYTGTVSLRWYYSVCNAGATVVCAGSFDSPGVTRVPLTSILLGWGTGSLATVTIQLTVTNDCQITAPNLDFGAAPLASSFQVVTRTISVACTAGASYSIGLGDGANFSTTRRMRRGATSDYLSYEIYRGATPAAGRWGSAQAGERRSSGQADSNPGVYDGSTLQGYTYSAAVNPAQATPAAGSYTDTVIVDVTF